MALGYDYLRYNNVTLPWGTANQTAYTQVETEGQSEDGQDLVITTRLNKPTYSYTFRVTSFWRQKLLEICSTLSGTLYINNDAGRIVRARLQNETVVPDSELTEGTDGLYDMTINFIARG